MKTHYVESQALSKPQTDWHRYSAGDAAWLLTRSVTWVKTLATEMGLGRRTLRGRWLFCDGDIDKLRAEIARRQQGEMR